MQDFIQKKTSPSKKYTTNEIFYLFRCAEYSKCGSMANNYVKINTYQDQFFIYPSRNVWCILRQWIEDYSIFRCIIVCYDNTLRNSLLSWSNRSSTLNYRTPQWFIQLWVAVKIDTNMFRSIFVVKDPVQ